MKASCTVLLCVYWAITVEGSCSPEKWKCSNKKCIPVSKRCDRQDNCGDGSDEENCVHWLCPSYMWKCGNHNCIYISGRCDGKDDCGDNSDEENCEGWKCPTNKWKCGNHRCIWIQDRCNGKNDCGDNSDERHCADWQCPSYNYMWKCRNNLCTKITNRCDGKNDCGDGSDEANCEQHRCPAYMWKCKNNHCIGMSSRCNGVDNCGDNSDEQNCDDVTISCPRYVMENTDQTCWCHARDVKARDKVSWPGLADSDTVSLTNVRRRDDDTQYACSVDRHGVKKQAVYTLRVAYGPYDEKMSVTSSELVVNGTRQITLTCRATEVYPEPYYWWGGVTCENQTPENTCIFTPAPEDEDTISVTCTAVSVTIKRAASTTVRLNLRRTHNFVWMVLGGVVIVVAVVTLMVVGIFVARKRCYRPYKTRRVNGQEFQPIHTISSQENLLDEEESCEQQPRLAFTGMSATGFNMFTF